MKDSERYETDLSVSILDNFRSTGSVGINSLKAEKAVFTLEGKKIMRVKYRRNTGSQFEIQTKRLRNLSKKSYILIKFCVWPVTS